VKCGTEKNVFLFMFVLFLLRLMIKSKRHCKNLEKKYIFRLLYLLALYNVSFLNSTALTNRLLINIFTNTLYMRQHIEYCGIAILFGSRVTHLLNILMVLFWPIYTDIMMILC